MKSRLAHPRSVSVATLLFIATAAAAAAESPLPPPPQIPYGPPIATEDAKRVAGGAIAEARRNNWSMAIAVVDGAGYLVSFERMPNTQLGSVDLSIEKARSAALFRRPTRVFQDAVAAGGEGLRVLRLSGAIPNEGGTPIVADGKIIGAIGVSGGSGEQDGQVAKAGNDILK